MQTFLPYPNFVQSAECLDWRRLGKQRVETFQIFNALKRNGGWKNHPAVRMWSRFEGSLVLYGIEICKEWIRRGYNDTMLEKFKQIVLEFENLNREAPPWLGDSRFHESHQSNLLRKNRDYYSQFGWSVDDTLPYFWPNP